MSIINQLMHPAAKLIVTFDGNDDIYKEYDLQEGVNIIGRLNEENDSANYFVEMPLDSMSRKHAAIYIEDECFIEDLGSLNGTRRKHRDAQPIRRSTMYELTSDTILWLGEARMTFKLLLQRVRSDLDDEMVVTQEYATNAMPSTHINAENHDDETFTVPEELPPNKQLSSVAEFATIPEAPPSNNNLLGNILNAMAVPSTGFEEEIDLLEKTDARIASYEFKILGTKSENDDKSENVSIIDNAPCIENNSEDIKIIDQPRESPKGLFDDDDDAVIASNIEIKKSNIEEFLSDDETVVVDDPIDQKNHFCNAPDNGLSDVEMNEAVQPSFIDGFPHVTQNLDQLDEMNDPIIASHLIEIPQVEKLHDESENHVYHEEIIIENQEEQHNKAVEINQQYETNTFTDSNTTKLNFVPTEGTSNFENEAALHNDNNKNNNNKNTIENHINNEDKYPPIVKSEELFCLNESPISIKASSTQTPSSANHAPATETKLEPDSTTVNEPKETNAKRGREKIDEEDTVNVNTVPSTRRRKVSQTTLQFNDEDTNDAIDDSTALSSVKKESSSTTRRRLNAAKTAADSILSPVSSSPSPDVTLFALVSGLSQEAQDDLASKYCIDFDIKILADAPFDQCGPTSGSTSRRGIKKEISSTPANSQQGGGDGQLHMLITSLPLKRTPKLCMCVSAGVPVISFEKLKEFHKNGNKKLRLSELPSLLATDEEFETKFNFSLEDSLLRPSSGGSFLGCNIEFIKPTKSDKAPPIEELKMILSAGQGILSDSFKSPNVFIVGPENKSNAKKMRVKNDSHKHFTYANFLDASLSGVWKECKPSDC